MRIVGIVRILTFLTFLSAFFPCNYLSFKKSGCRMHGNRKNDYNDTSAITARKIKVLLLLLHYKIGIIYMAVNEITHQ